VFSTTIRRVIRTGGRFVRLPKSGVKVGYASSRFAKIPPVSKKAQPWLGASLAETALLGSFSLFRGNRAFATLLSSSLEEKDSSDVANSKEKKNSNPYVWNVPLSMPYFVGRQALSNMIVTRLEQALQYSNVNHPPIVLSGMGGIGKTQLAIHCLHKLQTSSSVNCFWFETESPDRLDAAYRSFYMEIVRKSSEETANIESKIDIKGNIQANKVEIIGVQIKPSELTPDDICSIVKRWLADHPNCILVYDNVKDYESIQKFLPTSGGQVMILTRRAEWPANFTVHRLSALDRVDSIKLLTELGQVKGEDESVAELADKLEDLPLALAQAGAYIRYNKETAESYLKLYNKYRAEMLAEGTMPAGIAHVPVMVTWEMSLKEIDQQDASGITRTLFTLCAYGAPEGTLKILLRYYLETKKIPAPELRVNEAIKQLRNYSLLKVNEDGTKFVVHRLVQEVTRLHHEKERMLQKEDLIAWYTPWIEVTKEQFDRLNSDKQRMDYLAQTLAVIEHQERLFSEEENNTNLTLASIKTRAGSVLFHQGSYRVAKEQFERALKIQQAHHGKDHVEVAAALANLGSAYGSLGDYVKKRDYLERALKIQETYYGKDYIDIAITLANLGNAYGSLGDHVKERDYLERAFKIQEAHYGKDHIDVAITLADLGNAYGSLGDYAVMRDYLDRALKIKEAHYGKDHVDVAITVTNLGIAYGSLGDHLKKRDYLERALKIQEAHYGKDHVDVAITLANLGSAYGWLGNHVKARDYLDRALKIQEAHYGKDHVGAARTLTTLGSVYGSLGDHVKERNYLERALKIKEAHYGKDCVEVAITLTNLGRAYGLLGDHVKARDYLERALKIQETRYGKDHIDVAITLANLGTYGLLSDHVKARDYLERALKIKEAHYGKDYVDLVATLGNLGRAYGSLGDHAAMRDYLERALKIQEAHYGKDHVDVAITLANLGNAYGSLGDHVKGRGCLERALKIFMHSPYHGKNHPYTKIVIRQLLSMPLVTQASQTFFVLNKQPPSVNPGPSSSDTKLGVKPNGK